MAGEKRMWVEPALKVLVRSKSEESILSNCKAVDLPLGSNLEASGCGVVQELCILCQAVATS